MELRALEPDLIGRRGVFEADRQRGVPGQRPGKRTGGGERRRRCLDGHHGRAVRGAEAVTEAVADGREGTEHL